MTREEAQQVLDALEWFERRYEFAELDFSKQAIELLRSKLSEPEPQPAARWEPQVERRYSPEGVLLSEKIKHTPDGNWQDMPQWRGLTSTERKVLWLTSNNPAEFGEFIEAKLREKNERRA